MKVKVISRNPDEYLRETKRDIHKGKAVIDKTKKNLNLKSSIPLQHPETTIPVCILSRRPGSMCRR